ncbi:MAG: superoxide dismutase, Ni [Desulfobacteraceae bacterium]|nr:superoxide dismutase, Ni [Desulfobacteraceae bacterium]
MRQIRKIFVGMLLLVLGAVSLSYAHCEIPCGIYDDSARIAEMREHIKTIERSMNRIHAIEKDLEKGDANDYNQLVRWITNKEDHAGKLQHIVSQYFMTQRISADDKKYAEKISVLHQILVGAMRCKQTVDTEHVKSLRELVDRFEKLYMK